MIRLKTISVCCFLGMVTGYAQVNNRYDLRSSYSWHYCAIPAKQPVRYPESILQNDRATGMNRAKLCWYTIDPLFYSNDINITPEYIINDTAQLRNHMVRPVFEHELFPNSPFQPDINLNVLNLAYYPKEKGVYNFDVDSTVYSAGIDSSGNLRDPGSRWAGICRYIEKNLFTRQNLHYLGFWLMDPFVDNQAGKGGNLYIDIGNVSEDVLKDGRNSFENGLPNSSIVTNVDTTIWGRVPADIESSFGFNSGSYGNAFQDIGMDGLNDQGERSFYQNYLSSVENRYGIHSNAFQAASQDPSSDDYHCFRGTGYDSLKTDILCRYKRFNGLDGNSPAPWTSPENYPIAATINPDMEDINRNKNLDTAENYFQYKIVLTPEDLVAGQNFIREKRTVIPANGNGPVTWYKFLIPLDTALRETLGDIDNLDSSGYVRLVLKDFSEPVILRFAEMEFVTTDLPDHGDLADNTAITVYPNPCSGTLNIFVSGEGLKWVKISDITGKIHSFNEIKHNSTFYTIDLSPFANGFYLLEAATENHTYIRKILVENQ